MTERGPEGINFSESFSKSSILAEKFRKAEVIGQKTQEQNNVANVKVEEILSTSFPIHFQSPEQYDSLPQYKSVNGMIEVSKAGNKTEDVQNRAKSALFEVGLALSQNREVLKAATEGSDELNKLLPSNLHEIQPYILSVILTEGKDDVQGQELVTELVDLFKLKKKAEAIHGKAEIDYNEKKDSFLDKLYDKSQETVDEAALGRIETMMGYVMGIDEKVDNKKRNEQNNKGYIDENGDYQSFDFIPPTRNAEGEWEGGSRWELAPEYAAMAMKFMDHDMRWQSYTPPEWYKKLDGETQYRIDVMIAINEAAAGLSYAGKDLDKILGNKTEFSFSHEKMNKLYDKEFTLAESKMLNDLCEFYTDQNGIWCLRYKEKFYEYNYKTGKFIGENGTEIQDGDNVSRRREINEDEANRGNGVRTIDQDVMKKLENVMDYKESIAVFLASRKDAKYTWETYKKDTVDGKHKKGEIVKDEEGNPVPHWMNKMNAYTIWNKCFGMGDSSVWDRMRVLPTWDGIISDGVRTLNPEYKAKAKWQVMKSGKIRKDENLLDFEYFGGNVADYTGKVMRLEKDTGPIDKKSGESLRDKMLNRKVKLLSSKTYYGMLDFVNEGRDLVKNEGKSLAKVVMDYASFDEDNNYEIKGDMVKFREGQVTFMNEFRDSLEASITAYQYITSKAEAKDLKVWARTIKDKMGMLNGITWNGKRPFRYTRDPSFWRDVLVGTYGADLSRLSTDHISINNPSGKDGNAKSYSFYIFDLLKDDLGLNGVININKTMELLGVDINENEAGDSEWVRTKTNTLARNERIKTADLDVKQNKEIRKRKNIFPDEINKSIGEARKINYPGNSDFEDLKHDFEWALVVGEVDYAKSLAEAIIKFKPNRI